MSDDTYCIMCSTEPMRGILESHGLMHTVPYEHGDGPFLPTSDNLMEMLKPYGIFMLIWDKYEFSVDINGMEAWDYPFAETSQEALILAFGWTQGLKWEDGKWERR